MHTYAINYFISNGKIIRLDSIEMTFGGEKDISTQWINEMILSPEAR